MCGHTRDVVIYSTFHRNPFRSFWAPGGQHLAFPITLAIGFYNSLYYRTSRDEFVLRTDRLVWTCQNDVWTTRGVDDVGAGRLDGRRRGGSLLDVEENVVNKSHENRTSASIGVDSRRACFINRAPYVAVDWFFARKPPLRFLGRIACIP